MLGNKGILKSLCSFCQILVLVLCSQSYKWKVVFFFFFSVLKFMKKIVFNRRRIKWGVK